MILGGLSKCYGGVWMFWEAEKVRSPGLPNGGVDEKADGLFWMDWVTCILSL